MSRFVLVLSMLLLPAIQPGLAQEAATEAGQTQQAARPVFLQGFAEHSERLPSLAPQLQAGALFNAGTLNQAIPNNDWYWIPSWFAGQKHVETETVLQDYNFRTGQSININRVITNRQDLTIGFQQDRNGQIWEYKRAPYNTAVESDTFYTAMMVRNRDPLKVTQEMVVLRLLQTSVDVDKRSNRILKTLQEEQINTYLPVSPGLMSMQSSIKSFSADGSPLLQESSLRYVSTKAPFAPINYYQGQDMRALFQNYLLSHGLANLLPDDLKPQIPQAAAPENRPDN